MHKLFPRSVFALFALSVLMLASPPAHADRLTIKQPGDHPDYVAELEPHLILGLWGLPGPGNGRGVGLGFRASIEIVDNGFVKTINNTVAISFGLDWVHYDVNRFCGRLGRNDPCFYFDDDIDVFWFPVVMQWNFWLSENWSVFGEPGLAFSFWEHDVYNDFYDDDFNINFAFFAGGRFHFSDAVSLTMRLGFPHTFQIGVSFFL
jgi:hypothetical protein